MRWPRPTYANVTATLALFVALGGASYAAVSLPANSVGPRQLRPGAVGLRALGFPLGADSVETEASQTIPRNSCDQVLLPGEVAPPCTPAVGAAQAREVRVAVDHPATLLISAVTGLDLAAPSDVLHGPSGGSTSTSTEGEPEKASVAVVLTVDHQRQSADEKGVSLVAGEETQVPVQAVAYPRPGTATVGLETSVYYPTRGGATVSVGPASIIVTELPR